MGFPMTFFLRLMEGIYSGLLRLYPRKFQQEFRAEMQGVFASAVQEAQSTGWLALLQLLFFELLDFPITLAIEHFSQWRREWSMKDTRHEIRPFRSAALGALGLLVGLLIVMWESKYLVFPDWWYQGGFGTPLALLRELIPAVLTSALTGGLLGLMLCLSVSAKAPLALRACLLVTGLEVVATLIYDFIGRFSPYQRFISQFMDGNWAIVAIILEAAIFGMINGLFTGAGLGLSKGGWRSGWRFAPKGLLAYGLGYAVGVAILELWIASGRWIGITTYPITVFSTCICGILAGGILGWLWGRERCNESVELLQAAQ